jgi:hypothetical protein
MAETRTGWRQKIDVKRYGNSDLLDFISLFGAFSTAILTTLSVLQIQTHKEQGVKLRTRLETSLQSTAGLFKWLYIGLFIRSGLRSAKVEAIHLATPISLFLYIILYSSVDFHPYRHPYCAPRN